MSIPKPSGSGIAGAVAQIGSTLLSNISNARQNRKSRTFARGMYEKERADNLEFWRMQNEYNDPRNQRARLEAAGLNPALLYGSSSSGAAGAAGSIQAPRALQPSFNPADWSGLGAGVTTGINSMYDLEMKRQQTSNFQEQNNVLRAEVLNKAAQTFKTLQEGKMGKLKYSQERILHDISLDARREALRQMQVATDNMKTKELRNIEMHELQYKKGLEDIVQARIRNQLGPGQLREQASRIAGIMKDNKIKDFEIMLNKLGFSKSDPKYIRLLSTAADAYLQDVLSKLKK